MRKILNDGFTLLEVMISLVIFSIAFAAIIYAVDTGSRDLRYLTDKTSAAWVASNVLAEAQLGLNRSSFGRMQQLDRTWFWELKSGVSENPQIQKVTVLVSKAAREKPVTTLEGFIKNE